MLLNYSSDVAKFFVSLYLLWIQESGRTGVVCVCVTRCVSFLLNSSEEHCSLSSFESSVFRMRIHRRFQSVSWCRMMWSVINNTLQTLHQLRSLWVWWLWPACLPACWSLSDSVEATPLGLVRPAFSYTWHFCTVSYSFGAGLLLLLITIHLTSHYILFWQIYPLLSSKTNSL